MPTFKTYKTVDHEGNEVLIKLAHSPVTYIKYKEFTGRELFDDMLSYCQDKSGIDKKNEEQAFSIIFSSSSCMFYLELTAALVATAEYPNNRAKEDIIAELPDSLLYDADYMEILAEFITLDAKLLAAKAKRVKKK